MSLHAQAWLDIERSCSEPTYSSRVQYDEAQSVIRGTGPCEYMYETSRLTAVAKVAIWISLVCLSFANAIAADMSICEGNLTPPSSTSSSNPSRSYEEGRGTRVCGSNALYMLLKLYRIPVDHQQYTATVPVNDDGTSLAQLREAAAVLGLETTVRRCSIKELHRKFQVPFIAHLAMVTPHYSVVIDISDDSVTLLDGTTGEIQTLKRSWVEERWSGYVLLPWTDTGISPILLGTTMLNCLVVGFLVTKRYSYSRKISQINRES